MEEANAETDQMEHDKHEEEEPPPQPQQTFAPSIESTSSTETPIINHGNVIPENQVPDNLNSTNPVYPSSDPSLPDKSYKELDDALQRIYQEKFTEYSKIFSHHPSSDKKVKEGTWNDTVKEMKRQFNGQGQYILLSWRKGKGG